MYAEVVIYSLSFIHIVAHMCIQSMKSVTQRFWEKVDKTPGHGPNGDCWLWTGAKLRDTYGQFYISKGTNAYAHIFSWKLHNGEIPGNLYVCHKCDIKACCNPAHLFLGTAKDNAQDALRKGRKPGPKPYLTVEILDLVRAQQATGVSLSAVCRALVLPYSSVHAALYYRKPIPRI